MALVICTSILLSAGFLTVATETFAHFATVGTLWNTLKEFLLQGVLFTATALFWGLSVWLGLHWLGPPVDLLTVAELLGAAHLPMLSYPLAIVPTLGYRWAQILRFSVYSLFAGGLVILGQVGPIIALVLCLPGWLFHFVAQETRFLRKTPR